MLAGWTPLAGAASLLLGPGDEDTTEDGPC